MLSESILFIQGSIFWAAVGFLLAYNMLLLLASALILLGIAIVLLGQPAFAPSPRKV